MRAKRISEFSLVVAGACVIAAGLFLTFVQISWEFAFQEHLLDIFDKEYKWKPTGASVALSYIGAVVVAIGAIMMAFAAAIALRTRDAERAQTPDPPEKRGAQPADG